jgi:type VI secretion system protein ImpG
MPFNTLGSTARAAPARRDEMPGADLRKAAGRVEGVLVLPGAVRPDWHTLLPKTALQPRGFDEEDALLPSGQRSFQGYRLLQEYFAFAQRFLFVELAGCNPRWRACAEQELEIIVLLNAAMRAWSRRSTPAHFALNCTPGR